MPTIKYPNNPNVETAFVEQDDGTKNRVVLTAAQDISTIEYPNNPNSTKAYVTVNGKKQRVVMIADIAGGGGGGGGGDQHNLGWYATQSALEEAHPTATAGDWAIVGSTDTVWIWDTDTSAWKDSDQKGQVTSVNNKTGDVTIGANDVLPSQTGNAGKFLTTDGTDASWSDKPLANTATGTNSLTVGGGATAHSASVNVGKTSTANAPFVVAVGYQAYCGGTGSISIGANGMAMANNSILLNASGSLSRNMTSNTFMITNTNGEYEMMSANGTIPTARLTKVNSTITLTAAGWSSNTQTVSVTGMTATGVVLVSPDPTDQADYTSAGIICSAQAAGTLTFTCSTTPANDIDVVVVML